MARIGRWALTLAAGVSLASGCSSDPAGVRAIEKREACCHSKVLDGPYAWPSGAILSAVSTGPTSARLSWAPPTGSSGVALYRIYESGQPIATVAGTSPTFEIAGLATGTSYALAVQAEDGAGGATTDGPATTSTFPVAIRAPPGLPTRTRVEHLPISVHRLRTTLKSS